MYQGYIELGGNELGNRQRSLGYTRTKSCPIRWLQDDDCDTLSDALLDQAYTYDLIQYAPWFDIDDPDLSGRFLGAYILSITGLSDSTRMAVVEEKNGDGAQTTGYRHGSRAVRVRAILTAEGMDALEFGQLWLSTVLDPDGCGQSGVDCGTAEASFFVDCPPERGSDPGFTDWLPVGRNRVTNPSFESDQSIPAGAERSTDWAASGSFSLFVPFPTDTQFELRQNVETGISPLFPLSGQDLEGDVARGIYAIPEESRLTEVRPGIYRMEP